MKTISAEELCDEAELDRLRAFLDKQLAHLQGVVGRLANRLQRRLMAQQNRSWDFDLEEGYLDPARLPRVVVEELKGGFGALTFKRERDTNFRDTVVTLADRQFGLDARPADLSRRHLRRHSGTDARALRRQGGNPRLHDTGLEGRSGREKPGSSAANRPSRAASTICGTSSTRARTRRGAGRAQKLGLMMREGLLKENIDGEALTWALSALWPRGPSSAAS
jgi:cobaltochelatase CobT